MRTSAARTISLAVALLLCASMILVLAPGARSAVAALEYDLNDVLGDSACQFSFVHITDLHIGKSYADYGTPGYDDAPPEGDVGSAAVNLRNSVNWVNSHVSSSNIKFVMVTGDMTDSAEKSEFLKAKEILDDLEVPYVPMTGNHDNWQYTTSAESDYPSGDQVFREVFSDRFDSLAAVLPNWDDGTRNTPIWNGEADSRTVPDAGCNSYFQNYSFDYAGYHFICADYNSRNHKPSGRGTISDGEVFDSVLCQGTLPWLRSHFEAYPYKAAENILMFSHEPLLIESHSFSSDEYNAIASFLAQGSNENYCGLACCGHDHGDVSFDISYGSTNICPGVETPAVVDGDGFLRVIDVWGKTAQPEVDGVILYEDKDYSGRGELFVANDGSLAGNFIGDNAAESVRPWGSPSSTTLHSNTDYTGRYLDITAGSSDLSQHGFAGIASSVWVDGSTDPATPGVLGITPDEGETGTVIQVTGLTGSGFRSGASVMLTGESNIAAADVSVDTPSELTCNIDLGDAPPGSYAVEVVNTDGKNGTKTGAFTVTDSPPPSPTPPPPSPPEPPPPTPPPSPTTYPVWYLAEGSTAWGYSTYISIENPNTTAVDADITYMTSSGAVSGGTVYMPAKSQATVDPDKKVPDQDFSTKVACRQELTIAVDRTVTWRGEGADSEEAHSCVGVTSPARTWYLAEGSSAWGFETWLLVQNPNDSPATATITYMIEGESPFTVKKQIPANSRESFDMAEDIGAKDASIKVTSDIPLIAERAMYRNNRREGHDSIGTTHPSKHYYLAEGSTAWGFTTYVLVQNPNGREANVTLIYMTDRGAIEQKPFVMSANSRKTVRVNDAVPGRDLSTSVSADVPVIAERAMYWDSESGEACHGSIGMASAHSVFYLPDGQSSDGRETWTLVQNPNPQAVTIKISYFTSTGEGSKTITGSVPANSRKSYSMASSLPDSRGAIMVTCETPGKKIICERSMYWNTRGVGTNTIGGYSD